MGGREITALLAKLYADWMTAAREGQASENAPRNVPELMLQYLFLLTRQDPENHRETMAAAKVVGWESLRQNFRPSPVRYDTLLNALGPSAKARLKSLEHNHVVLPVIGGAMLDRIRFVLAPLAEYLAALYLIEHYRDDGDAWRDLLRLADEHGPPEAIHGFLAALHDC